MTARATAIPTNPSIRGKSFRRGASAQDKGQDEATVDGEIGNLLEFHRSLQGQGLEQSGSVGMAAWAKSAIVNTSITNFFAAAPPASTKELRSPAVASGLLGQPRRLRAATGQSGFEAE